MNVIIIDNEKNVVEGLVLLLANYLPELKVVGTAATVDKAVLLIKKTNVDLLFLDIELDDGTGMEVLKQVTNRNFQVIFITAYDKYAVEAFKFSAIDFLLKPIDPDDLIIAVSRAKTVIQKDVLQLRMETFLSNTRHLSHQNKKIIVSDREHIHALAVKDILYMEADGAYTKINLSDKIIMTSKNLKTYEQLLLNAGFFRTHHSFLVNLSQMSRFDKSNGVLILSNEKEVAVSFRKKEALLAQIKLLSF